MKPGRAGPRAGGRKRRGEEADWQALRYVFVVTYGRSGSTLLQSLLNACKGVQIRGENGNVLYHLYRAAMAARSTRKIGTTPQTVVPDGPWYGAGAVRPVLFEAELIGNFVRCVLAPDDGIAVTGFKEIRYNRNFVSPDQFAGYMDFLLNRFPGAKIVFNSRRAEDVAKSSFFTKQNPHVVMGWIRDCDTAFAAYDAASDCTIHLRYDDYVQDHGLIHAMLDFLNLDWTPEAVEQVFAKPLTHATKGGDS